MHRDRAPPFLVDEMFPVAALLLVLKKNLPAWSGQAAALARLLRGWAHEHTDPCLSPLPRPSLASDLSIHAPVPQHEPARPHQRIALRSRQAIDPVQARHQHAVHRGEPAAIQKIVSRAIWGIGPRRPGVETPGDAPGQDVCAVGARVAGR
jgi:hypothetical protein